MAFNILIEATEPGARIEANGEYMGETPLKLKVFGDPDGTFHDFGSPYFVLRALPKTTNQYAQTRYFRTGQLFMGEDRIPERVYFDMNDPVSSYQPPIYYSPPPVYYPAPYYYGPSIRFHFGPGFGPHYPYYRYWR